MTLALGFALFVLAAGIASVARLYFSFINKEGRFPLGTIAVNIIGCFFMGYLSNVQGLAKTIGLVACLGAFTTYSTFIKEIFASIEQNKRVVGAIYFISTFSLCMASYAIGRFLS